MARVGKIARLSHWVRTQLNERLRDGEAGPQLVAWLNSLSGVQEVLAEHFGGRGITVQNLSEWRKGGYADWQREEPMRQWVETLTETDRTLEETTGSRTIADRVSSRLVIAMGQCLQHLMEQGDPGDPEYRDSLLRLSREIARQRNADSQELWWNLEKGKFEHEVAEQHRAEIEAMKKEVEWKERLVAYGESFRMQEEARKTRGRDDQAETDLAAGENVSRASRGSESEPPAADADRMEPVAKATAIRPNPGKSKRIQPTSGNRERMEKKPEGPPAIEPNRMPELSTFDHRRPLLKVAAVMEDQGLVQQRTGCGQDRKGGGDSAAGFAAPQQEAAIAGFPASV